MGLILPLPPDPEVLDRRLFLKHAGQSILGGIAILGGLASNPVLASQRSNQPQDTLLDNDFWNQPRRINLYRPDTGERANVNYWRDGKLDVDGYVAACRLLRDVHQNIAVQMDPGLLDLFRGITGYISAYAENPTIIITSGYRTHATNKKLRESGIPAARRSYHLYGKAADYSIAGIEPRQLAAIAKYYNAGGVGIYDKKGFVHMDMGPARRVWQR